MGFYKSYGKDDSLMKPILPKNITLWQDRQTAILQEFMHKLGITVHRSPKYHEDISDKGIEYSRGYAKNNYWRLPISEKQTKENF